MPALFFTVISEFWIKSGLVFSQSRELSRQTLREQINLKCPLVQLADLINWDRLRVVFSESFPSSGHNWTATSLRLITGLAHLQHLDLSDENVVWMELGGKSVLTGVHWGSVDASRAID